MDVAAAVAQILAGAPYARVLRTALAGLDRPTRDAAATSILATVVTARTRAFSIDDHALVDALGHGGPVQIDDRRARALVDAEKNKDAPSFAIAASLPDWIAADLVDALADPVAFMAASNVPGPLVVRARDDRAALARALLDEGVASTPTRLSPWGLVLHGRPNVFGLAAWRAGLFEVQDEGSQLVAHLCAPKSDDVVLDLCAGRGGKALALAPLCRRVLCHDVAAHADRRARVRRARVDNVVDDDGTLADVVLVDAPCSSLGPLRRSPDLRWRLHRNDVAELPALQRALLRQAAARVQPGGVVVYATCTVRRAENDDVVAAALQDGLLVPDAPSTTLLPHVHGTDGFFVARFRRL